MGSWRLTCQALIEIGVPQDAGALQIPIKDGKLFNSNMMFDLLQFRDSVFF